MNPIRLKAGLQALVAVHLRFTSVQGPFFALCDVPADTLKQAFLPTPTDAMLPPTAMPRNLTDQTRRKSARSCRAQIRNLSDGLGFVDEPN